MSVELRLETDIHRAWPSVAEQISEALSYSPDRARPGDVFVELCERRSFLYTARDGDEYLGCFVITPKLNRWTGRRRLHIWLLWAKGHAAWLPDGLLELEDIAANANAEALSFASPRRGWGRLLNWPVEDIIYVKRL